MLLPLVASGFLSTLFCVVAVILSSVRSQAYSTPAMRFSSLARHPNEISSGVRVPSFAVGLPGILSSQRLSAHQILSWCNRLKMKWIYTRADAAQVIEDKTFRDRESELLENPAGASYAVSVDRESSIPSGSCTFLRPNPTSDFIERYLGKEALQVAGRFVCCVPMCLPPLVMLLAPGPLYSWGGTVDNRALWPRGRHG